MTKISILVPCYNEALNIENMAQAITEQMHKFDGIYDYEIIFRDNNSTDNSVQILRRLSADDPHIKAIVNARNYGVNSQKNSFYGRVSGDVIISIVADFQTPPSLISEFIHWWEQGYEVVCGQKTKTEEKGFKYIGRQLFYSVIEKMSPTPQFRNMTGITLMTRRIYDMERESDMPHRYFLSDLGCDIKLVPYKQAKRKEGKSSFNYSRYFSYAISSLISTSTVPLRLATILGCISACASLCIGLLYLVLKLIMWNRFAAGMAPVLIGMFFIGSIQLFFIGIIGEYVGSILAKVSHVNPPLVKELIGFDNPSDDKYYVGKRESEE